MSRAVAVFGGSFNPPGIHHREIARRLARELGKVVIVPCGPRPDKEITDDVPPIYRAAMVDMTFRGLANVRVDLFDLEASTFTRTHDLETRYRDEGELWHVVSAEMVAGGHRNQAVIQTQWERGAEIWQRFRFVVLKQPGTDLAEVDLPPHHRVVVVEHPYSSSEIRDRVFHHRPFADRVVASVADYITRHRLYRGMRPPRSTWIRLDELRPLIFSDPRNPPTAELAAELGPSDEEDPNLIVVIGGDGTMLHAIRQHWRRRIPFYGINTGHMGFLLNSRSPRGLLQEGLGLEQSGLLWVATKGADGQTRTSLAFNDAWVERSTGQTASLRVTINGETRLPTMVADGALVATAAGSTSYARAMGATPLPLNTPAMLLVGSNVLHPPFWRPAVLSLESTVELTTLDPEKRPLLAYVDGIAQGEVRQLQVRSSNIATVELAFEPGHHPAEKLARIQFPLTQ